MTGSDLGVLKVKFDASGDLQHFAVRAYGLVVRARGSDPAVAALADHGRVPRKVEVIAHVAWVYAVPERKLLAGFDRRASSTPRRWRHNGVLLCGGEVVKLFPICLRCMSSRRRICWGICECAGYDSLRRITGCRRHRGLVDYGNCSHYNGSDGQRQTHPSSALIGLCWKLCPDFCIRLLNCI